MRRMAHFLLLHGAGHGGWCWDRLTPCLVDGGHDATCPDLPCDDLAAGLNEYADSALAVLSGATDDLVVVGHSLGALVAPLVASRIPVRRDRRRAR